LSLQKGEQGLKFSSHPRIYLEALLVKLCHYRRLTSLEDLLKQVQELGGGDLEKAGPEARKPRKSETAPKSVPKAVTAPDPSPPPPPSREAEEPPDAPPAGRPEVPPLPEENSPDPGRNASGDPVFDDPAVKNFMQTFKAQILSVEPKKGEKVVTRDIKDLVD
jgi:DNA polymerase-3 subunit gamma/tau